MSCVTHGPLQRSCKPSSARRAAVPRVAAPALLHGNRRLLCPAILSPESAQSLSSQQRVPANVEEALELGSHFNKAFSTSLYTEHAYWVKKIDGQIPEGLKGTLLRNGPGLFEVGGKPLAHPFDGDGMICSLSFDGEGRAFFQNKFVRTPGFLAERRTGKQQYRSSFNKGVLESGGITIDFGFLGKLRLTNPFDILNVKDAANTNVLRWGGKTLALFEASGPTRLDDNLETLGPDNLGDTMSQPIMAAHLRITQEEDGSSRAVMFAPGVDGGRDSKMNFYEYARDFSLLHRTQTIVPGAAFGFFHDMAVSEHWYVVVENPVKMDVMRLIMDVPQGKASVAECLRFQESQPARLHLIPRPGRGAPYGGVRSYDIPGSSIFTFHHSNAWEAEGGRYLVLDSVSNGFIDFGQSLDTVGLHYYGNSRSRVEPSRISVDLSKPVHPSAVTRSVITPRSCEFPVVAPSKVGRPHRYTYMVGSPVRGGAFFGPNQGIVKMTVDASNGVGKPFDHSAVEEEIWLPPSRYMFPGEPVFVPRDTAETAGRAEDDGWVMTWLFDSEHTRSSLVILDAQRLSEGPVATVHLDNHHVPAGLHGMWTNDYLGPAPGTPDRHPYDIRDGV